VTGLADMARSLLEPGALGFAHPLWIPPLLALAAFAAWRSFRAPGTAYAWPAVAEARAAGAWRRDPQRAVLGALRAGALLALALSVAGPLRYGAAEPDRHRGLDLVLAVDASGSMRALDAEVDGEWLRRLDLAREVVARFAARRVGGGDRVGLVVFGDTAFTLCPLTSDGALLEAALGRLEAGMAGESTALGDALSLAVKRAAGGRAASRGAGAAPVAGQLVVLLTDGRSNAGAVPTDVAGALARATGTRVHTVGIGGRGEVAMAARSGPGRELEFQRHDLDRETLREIAEASGGRFFEARSSGDLHAVYDEIDGLERVLRPTPPRSSARPAPEPFLAGAGLLLLAEIAIGRVLWRRIP